MIIAPDKNKLYSAITPKKYSTAREYLSSTYGEPRVRFYNADTKDEMREKKRLKARHFALLVAAISVVAGIVSIISFKNKPGFSAFSNKIVNALCNFNNIKDDYLNKFTDKLSDIKVFNFHPFSFVKKAGDKITDFYKTTVKSSFSDNWNKSADNISKLAKKEGTKIDIEKFDNWYDSLSDDIYGKLHEKNNRITDNLLNEKFFNRFTNSIIADEKIQDVAKNALNKVEIPDNASQALKREIEKFNELKLNTASTLTPKLRDINLGCGPSDVLNQTITLLSLLTAIAASKTKEEKRSVAINVGIPLLTGLATATIATLKALSGATALAFGLIAGECASIVANLISKSINKVSNKK